jgi:hypothetical protein
VLATDAPAPADRVVSTAMPSARGVVLALDVGEADAVLTGHGSLEGPVVVTLVAVPN